MVCPHCRREIPEEALFCGACGRRVIAWQQSPDSPPAHVLADGKLTTAPVRPGSEAPRAVDDDPEATREVRPNSELLAVVSGAPKPTAERAAPRSLIDATRVDEEDPASPGEPAAVPAPRAAASAPGVGTSQSSGDTRFLVEAALGRRQQRLWLLLVADACLLVVGAYLIITWSVRRGESAARPAGQRGYISWDETKGLIADAPLRLRFIGRHPMSSVEKALERRPGYVAAAQRLVRGQRAAIESCHQQSEGPEGRPRGFLDVLFIIDKRGNTRDFQVTRDTTGAAGLGDCVRRALEVLRFAPPPTPTVSVVYPIRFSSS